MRLQSLFITQLAHSSSLKMSGSQGARGYGSASTDSLLQTESTGSGYGLINGKRTRRVRANSGPERWQVVAFCALTACIASMVAGMSLSFPSIIINELDVVTEKEEWKIASNGTEASLIGVSLYMWLHNFSI